MPQTIYQVDAFTDRPFAGKVSFQQKFNVPGSVEWAINWTPVKDGFIQIDESPFNVAFFNDLMKYTTLKVGHFEVNYGDQHFRRSDNGMSFFNPFVGNLLIDAFLGSPEVKSCFPPDWQPEQVSCKCSPRLSVSAASGLA